MGAGQTLGETIGNGRATAILFAREGARVMLADRDLESSCEAMAAACVKEYERIDILHTTLASEPETLASLGSARTPGTAFSTST